MAHTIHDKKKLIQRVRRIRGQVEGLERSLDQEVECAAVLQQVAAVRGAITGLMKEILEGHLREHVADPQLDERKRAQAVEEVMELLRVYLR